MNGEFCFTSESKIDEQSGLTIHDSHKKRSIEVMATCLTVNQALRVRNAKHS